MQAEKSKHEPQALSTIEHTVKCWPEFFEAILTGAKRHDLRRADDRPFRVGGLFVASRVRSES